MNDKDYPDLSTLIGKRVRRCNSDAGDDTSTCEVGIIVHAWIDKDLEATDCYVAFFGNEWPALGNKPEQIPYVLRYFLSSLEEIR